MRFTVWFGSLLCLVTLLKVQGQDTRICARGDTAVLSCGVTLTGGLTLRLATWRKVGPPDVIVADYLIGTSTAGGNYTGRASINDTGFLLLEQVTQADAGTYRCEATLSDLSSLPVVDVEVDLPDRPDIRGVTVNATKETLTSAKVKWNEIPVSSECDDDGGLTYYVDYKLDVTTSPWTNGTETISGTTNGNEILNFTVTSLDRGGDYVFGVRAKNSVGFSNRAISAPVNIIGAPNDNKRFVLEVLVPFDCQGLYATILIAAILVAEECKRTKLVKHLGSIGPLLGVVLAVAVIVVGFVPPNNGYGDQEGFTSIMVIAGVAGGMSIGASIAGFLHKKHIGLTMKFPVATISLEFSLCLMTSISGIVVPAVTLQPGIGLSSIVLSAVCIVLLLAVFTWYLYKVCATRGSSRVSQDLSEARSQNQVKLEQQSAGSDGNAAIPEEPSKIEVKTSDIFTKSVHEKPGMLPPLPPPPPKQKKKTKGKRKKKAAEDNEKVPDADQPV